MSSHAEKGLSNPQIAQTVFVTRRTVEMHLTNAYRKLGIQTREELARVVADEQESAGQPLAQKAGRRRAAAPPRAPDRHPMSRART